MFLFMEAKIFDVSANTLTETIKMSVKLVKIANVRNSILLGVVVVN